MLMNFFFLHLDPRKCARYHGDKHINKMQTEYAQILSTVWYKLVFDRDGDDGNSGDDGNGGNDRNGGDRGDRDYTIGQQLQFEALKKGMYKKTHVNHPVVLWAAKSLAHYNAILDLGVALGDEKRRRIEQMKLLPKRQQKKWKPVHQSESVLRFLQQNKPSIGLFPNGDSWEDPPKCMPEYLHCDENGNPFTVEESYQLFYSGNKIKIARLKWEPYVETPDFVPKWQEYIENTPRVKKRLQRDYEKSVEKKAKKKPKRTSL